MCVSHLFQIAAVCVSHLFQIAVLIPHYCVEYARFMLALIFQTYESEMKRENQPQDRTSAELTYQITGTKAGSILDISKTTFRHDFHQDQKIMTRNKSISSRQMHPRRHFYRMKRYIFLKKITCLWERKTKSKLTHVTRSNSSFSPMDSFLSYHLHKNYSKSENYSSSSESDDDMELSTDEELAGESPEFVQQNIADIVNIGQVHEANIAGSFPIQCEEDILDQRPILFQEESQVHPGCRFVLSSLETNGCQVNDNYNRYILDSPYIDLHPEIPVGGIQVHHDPQNAEFSEQAANDFQAFLERIKELMQTNCIRRCSGINHDLIYQEFLRDPDKNSIRDPIQESGDNSTSGLAAEVNVPGTELENAPMCDNSPIDDGIGASGATSLDTISRQNMPVVLPHTCVFCGKRQVSIRFQPCQHAISCQQCSVSKHKCSACGKVIDQKILV